VKLTLLNHQTTNDNRPSASVPAPPQHHLDTTIPVSFTFLSSFRSSFKWLRVYRGRPIPIRIQSAIRTISIVLPKQTCSQTRMHLRRDRSCQIMGQSYFFILYFGRRGLDVVGEWDDLVSLRKIPIVMGFIRHRLQLCCRIGTRIYNSAFGSITIVSLCNRNSLYHFCSSGSSSQLAILSITSPYFSSAPG
jgi:hypothetical protein